MSVRELSGAQSKIDTVQEHITELRHHRQRLVRTSHLLLHSESQSLNPLNPLELQIYVALVALTVRELRTTHDEVRALTRQSQAILLSPTRGRRSQATLSASELSEMKCRMIAMNSTWADTLDEVSALARVERQEVESGECEKRMAAVGRSRRCEWTREETRDSVQEKELIEDDLEVSCCRCFAEIALTLDEQMDYLTTLSVSRAFHSLEICRLITMLRSWKIHSLTCTL